MNDSGIMNKLIKNVSMCIKSIFHTLESVFWSICCDITKSYKCLGSLNLKRQPKIITEF